MDSNFDELENSIVESLSEMSIASNAVLNTTTQEYLNRTITEVISLYLWSNDFKYLHDNDFNLKPVPKPRIRLTSDEDEDSSVQKAWDNQHYQHNKSNNKTIQNKKDNLGIKVVHEEDLDNDTPKASPRKTSSQKPKFQSDSHFMKEEVKSSQIQNNNNNNNKIPLLDFRKLNSESPVPGDNLNKNQQKDENKDKLGNAEKKEKKTNVLTHSNEANKKPTNIVTITPNRTKESKLANNEEFFHKKSTPKTIKSDIRSLMKELKLIKPSTNIESNEYYDETNEIINYKQDYNDKFQSMEADLKELLLRLFEKRKSVKRNHDLEKMTRDELTAEKIDTQKELLTFESQHGRPQTKLEKDLMRPLYDHYRKLKRFIAKINNDVNGQSVLVQEDEYNSNEDYLTQPNNQLIEHQKAFKNLHSLNLNELVKEKEMSLNEKFKLKELIKEHENDFTKKYGRALSKEDRNFYKDDFEKYKVIKAKLKLIEALIEKYKNDH